MPVSNDLFQKIKSGILRVYLHLFKTFAGIQKLGQLEVDLI